MVRFEDPGNSSGQPGGSLFLDRLITALRKTFGQLAKTVTNDHIVSATLSSMPTAVTHGLGFVPVSWDVVDLDANVTIWRVGQATASTITLQATSTVHVKLRFA